MSLSIVLHGESGTGKSTLAASSPAPRLILDSEGGARFVPGRKMMWDPLQYAPPECADTWDTCLTVVRDYATMETAYQWLASGKHCFKSVVIDSLTEMQKRVIDQTAGIEQPTQQDWGAILRHMEDLVRKTRDLLFHPSNPLECVTYVCLTHFRDLRFRAWVKGQLEISLPGFVDVIGYQTMEAGMNGGLVVKLKIAPTGDVEAKDRTRVLTEKFGPIIENPNLAEMVNVVAQLDQGAP